MIYIIILFLFFFVNITQCAEVGSTLFFGKNGHKDCWSEEDIAKLRARRLFEEIAPPKATPGAINENYIEETLKYYRDSFSLIESQLDKYIAVNLKEVLADTIGAHMRSEILPAARFAYYAGYVPYRSVRKLHDYFDQLKLFLNTQGLGWKKSNSIPEWKNFTVEKIHVGSSYLFDPCVLLLTKRDSKSCIHLPPPKSDDHFRPSAIALPLKKEGLFSLVSPVSENVLLKYYTTVLKCLLSKSPETCRHSDFVSFNNELWHWMKRDVAPRLTDEKLYAAFGGVLRVAAAVQGYEKGLNRRNLFEYQDAGVTKWHPWKALKESYVYVNTDWTPHLYVAIILIIGLAICLLQICYSYILGDESDCHCRRSSHSSISKNVASYAKVDSNIPAMLPAHHSAVYYTDKKRTKKPNSQPKTASLGSLKTQKVYDLNERTEKMMAVIMSDNEASENSAKSSESSQGNVDSNDVVKQQDRPKSPPKIETPITQMKVDRKPIKNKPEIAMYSTSTVTNSELTYQARHAMGSWSGSDSSTSAQSGSTASSKSRCRRSRSSRDLAWARRVISKHSINAKSTSTELDINSYTTPQSHR